MDRLHDDITPRLLILAEDFRDYCIKSEKSTCIYCDAQVLCTFKEDKTIILIEDVNIILSDKKNNIIFSKEYSEDELDDLIDRYFKKLSAMYKEDLSNYLGKLNELYQKLK